MSQASGSRYSKGSRRSKNSYRTVSRKSYDDPTLYGKGTKKEMLNPLRAKFHSRITFKGFKKPTDKPGKAPMSYKERQKRLNNVKKQVYSGNFTHPDVVVISQSELQRMREAATIFTNEEIIAKKKLEKEQKEKQQAIAIARKKKLQRLAVSRSTNLPLTAHEKEKQKRKQAIIQRAKDLRNEDRDEVKEMNKMIMYAKVVTIRDKQLKQKKRIRQRYIEEEKMKDLMMEIDRLKAIKYQQAIAAEHKVKQKVDHQMIIQQIKGRELQRIRAKEEVEKEGQMMLKAYEQMVKEDEEKIIRKRVEAEKMLEDIDRANQEAILVKQQKALEIKKEEQKIVEYVQAKLKQEAEQAADAQRIKDEKEKEVQRLRDLQEKAVDRQADIDALRARRAMEEADRKTRIREQREAEKAHRNAQELFEARKIQMAEKEMRLAKQARKERDAFQRILAEQKVQRQEELVIQKRRTALLKLHSKEIRKQIQTKEENAKQKKTKYLEEGKALKKRLLHEKALLEQIKKDKLALLYQTGVDPKYCTELARKKITL